MSSGTGARLKRYYPRLDREVAMRLVIVSNRVACPKGDEPIEGGLAAALLPAVRTSGAIWVGSSGRFRGPADKESFAKVEALGTGAVATIDLPRDTYQKFYEGFANSALWPVLHSRTDLIRTDVEQYTAYREINSLMARAVLRFARPDAMFWIDVESFAERAGKSAARREVSMLRSSLQGARLVIGVDRVAYSKGLPNRLRAFDRMLQFQPALKRAVTLLQIAVPSRAKIDAYRQLQEELAALVGDINGRHSEVDWVPIRYLNKGFSQAKLAGLYRTARVGLVTPLNDGMNLVAKEYVAAQNPLDPGVLVLSKFAGAARQLDSALLVNPHDIDAVARAISNGLGMPNEERRERWGAMMETLQSSSLKVWMNDFVSALTACPRTSRFGLAPDLSVEPPPRRRAELAAIQNR